MNEREINLIKTNIKYWDEIKSSQYKLKKADRNPELITSAQVRIATMKRWLSGGEEKVKVVEEHLDRKEFDKAVAEVTGEEVKAVLELNSREEVDRMWKVLITQNVQVKCPIEIGDYIKQKMKLERPYGFLSR